MKAARSYNIRSLDLFHARRYSRTFEIRTVFLFHFHCGTSTLKNMRFVATIYVILACFALQTHAARNDRIDSRLSARVSDVDVCTSPVSNPGKCYTAEDAINAFADAGLDA